MNRKNSLAQKQYLRSKILTASPAELILILYDGYIQFCNQAISAIQKDDYEEANNKIQKAERIIGELKISLNFKCSTAQDFDRIYTYILRRLHEANIYKDIDILKECIGHIKELKETWKQVMEKTIKEKK